MERLKDIWDKLPDIEHTKKYTDKFGTKIYEVCDRKFQETTSIDLVIDCLQKYYDNYGERARQAKLNKNIDWKSLSHAIRAAIQLKELYTDGKITFPLKEAMLIKYIKKGLYNYKWVSGLLERYIEDVKLLAEQSNYPAKVDRKFWDRFLIDVIEENLNEN